LNSVKLLYELKTGDEIMRYEEGEELEHQVKMMHTRGDSVFKIATGLGLSVSRTRVLCGFDKPEPIKEEVVKEEAQPEEEEEEEAKSDADEEHKGILAEAGVSLITSSPTGEALKKMEMFCKGQSLGACLNGLDRIKKKFKELMKE